MEERRKDTIRTARRRRRQKRRTSDARRASRASGNEAAGHLRIRVERWRHVLVMRAHASIRIRLQGSRAGRICIWWLEDLSSISNSIQQKQLSIPCSNVSKTRESASSKWPPEPSAEASIQRARKNSVFVEAFRKVRSSRRSSRTISGTH